jgi:hypothetical protein
MVHPCTASKVLGGYSVREPNQYAPNIDNFEYIPKDEPYHRQHLLSQIWGHIGDELLVCGSFHTIIKVCEILNCHGIMIFFGGL